ncbi:hypothetical protein [Streptomyces scopuliridis]|uniref:hypothetical protein n=1 Tax=Streptomyces scopuliridis TaxID=452529 RepID=UPI003422567A
MSAPLTPQREAIIRQQQPGDWLSGAWTIREMQIDGTDVWQVLNDGTVLATLPDWAGNLALWIAETHEDVPELLAMLGRSREDARAAHASEAILQQQIDAQAKEIDRLRAQVADLEGAAVCPSRITTWLRTAECVMPVRHKGDHRNATKNHYWDDEHADAPTIGGGGAS